MAGEAHLNGVQEINWVEKYIDKLSRDMEEIRGMETRLTERINESNRHMQNLVLAMIIGIGAITIAIAVAAR